MAYEMTVASCFILVLHIAINLSVVKGQLPTTQPNATNQDCICKPLDKICKCTLIVQPTLTMIYMGQLIKPDKGILRYHSGTKKGQELTPAEAAKVLTADGQTSRLVISVNGQFSGPRIEVYENQTIEIKVVNNHHTDSITIHFHGLHQRDTPWMDGVAFVTQCPILAGQTFVHRFKAYPPGTSLYHAHIGDQRSQGLYGPIVVRAIETKSDSTKPVKRQDEIIVTLQDWNHELDAETAFYRAMSPEFNLRTGDTINNTKSLDGAMFSHFVFHSGLINGKGRYWYNKTVNNGAPLEKFIVHYGKTYYFRVISASTLYPMRIYIEGQTLTLKASDVSTLKPIEVQSIILHPGERYDFEWKAPASSTKKEILLIAKTLETDESLGRHKYHAAEAIIEFAENPDRPNPDPVNDHKENCTETDKCVVFNCPFGNYGSVDRTCLNFNNATIDDPRKRYDRILGNTVNEEYFFNFGFPGTPGHAPGSVNGRQFIFPTMSLLTEPGLLLSPCNEQECTKNGTCSCTYSKELRYNKLVQMTFINLGNGSGWTHPIHMHGHFFYVMKMGLGKSFCKPFMLFFSTRKSIIILAHRLLILTKCCGQSRLRSESFV